MSDSSKAVFLSYASQDSEAAKRIADALRAAGVEVWFDQNELVGGDAWDTKIRRQIAECALFVPVISANTQARLEGYFRLEWKIAARRTHAMATAKAFLLPVVIDDTHDAAAHVPEEFRDVQWTRLARGDATAKFCARVQALLDGSPVPPSAPGAPEREPNHPVAAKPRSRWITPVLSVVVAAIALAIWQPWQGTATPVRSPASAGPTLTEAERLIVQAKALLDEEPLTTRETFRTAQSLCENALKLSPQNAEAWATLARANCELVGNYREGGEARVELARSQAERALQLAPDSIEAGLAMAAIDLDLLRAEPVAVRTRLEGMLRRAPDDHRILLLLAMTEDRDQVSESAFRWLAQAEALPGGKARSALRQAWIYWGANRLRESLAAVERSLAVQPLTEAYHLKLMLHCIMEDSEGALRWLKQIPPLILREDRPASIAYETFYFGRQPEDALRVLRAIPREIFEEGRYFEVRALLAGDALLMAGKPRAAEVEFRTALKVIDERLAVEPRNSRLWHAKGRVQYHLGDRTAAEGSFTTARELGGLRTIDLAMQSQLLGRTEEALALVDQAMDRRITRWPSWLYYLKRNPVFDPLRSDVRFQRVIARGEAWLAEDLGNQDAKSTGAGSRPQASAVEEKSVAVLAFANLSDDKANEYFSDGISEELLNVLAKVPGLKVSARTSAFHFKGKDTPIAEIAKQLGVAYVVEGSVRKAGDKVRITAQLIKAADGFHVWSDTFTRDLKDVFAVQDEIAGVVARNLSLQLGVIARPARQGSPEAIALLAEGRHYWSFRTKEGFARAGELYAKAIKLDPEWPRAYAALANLQVIESSFRSGDGEDMTALFAEAERNALRAISLDPELADAYAALGKLATDRREWSKSAEYLAKALALDPNNVAAHDWSADLSLLQGRLDLALAGYRRALELDPLSPFVLFDNTWALLHLRRFAEMRPLIERAVGLTPGSRSRLAVRRAHVLLRLGFRDEAAEALRPTLPRLRAGEDGAQISEAIWCLRTLGWTSELDQLTAEVLARPQPTFAKGVLLAAIGRVDEAYPYLALATPIMRQVLYFDPVFDPVRDKPEFRQVLRQLGCEEEHKLAQETLSRILKEGAVAL
jgi:TolB-like protein/Tfp pilus assembly protein PilF